jgi:hypothetical protein
MAATTYLSQPASLTIGGVQLADQCSAVTLTLGQNPLVSTAFGDTGERMVGGLQTVEGTITLYCDYGANSVEATVAAELGAGDTAIVIRKDAGAPSASNPEWLISDTMIANYPVTYTVGELQVMEVAFSGGTWVRDVTP